MKTIRAVQTSSCSHEIHAFPGSSPPPPPLYPKHRNFEAHGTPSHGVVEAVELEAYRLQGLQSRMYPQSPNQFAGLGRGALISRTSAARSPCFRVGVLGCGMVMTFCTIQWSPNIDPKPRQP